MKVAIVSSAHPRGHSRVFAREAASIAAIEGIDLVGVVADGGGDGVFQGIEYVDLGKPKGRADRILHSRRKLIDWVRHARPDVVHFHMAELLPAVPALNKLGCKTIYDAHEFMPKVVQDRHWVPAPLKKILGKATDILELRYAKQCTAVVAATSTISGRFAGVAPVYLVRNLPDLAAFPPRTQPRAVDPLRIVYFGSITAVRGIGEAVDALDIVARQHGISCRMDLIGPISPPALLEDLQSRTGWEFVDYHGPMPQAQALEYLHRATAGLVAILPAQNHVESEPNKIWEYMACELPIIGSNFPLWKETLAPMQVALLVDPTEPEEIAAAIEKLAAHPESVVEMGRRGRQLVEDTLNWSVADAELCRLYADLGEA